MKSINVSIIITGPDKFAVAAAEAGLSAQTLRPCQVQSFVAPMPDELRNAISSLAGDYVYVMRSSSKFLTDYSLERKVLEKVLHPVEPRKQRLVPSGFWDVVLTREELPIDAAEILAWPEDVPSEVQPTPLDDRMKRRLAGVAKSLWALDMLPESGRFFQLVGRLSELYRDDESRRFLCAMLHVADYFNRREFLNDKDWLSMRESLDELHNLAWENVQVPEIRVSETRVKCPSESPDITYIVPVHDVAQYLPRCLESLRRQILSNLEIICIDDGSTDASPMILDAFAARDERIRVVHKENEGVGAARNLALSMARGKFVSFVDGDDWISVETAATAVAVAECNRLDFCSYDIAAFNHKTRANIPIYWSLANQARRMSVGKVLDMSALQYLMIHASACLAVYRKSFLDSVGFRFANLKLGEDLTFTMTIWPQARQFMLLNRPFYHYRRGQPGSAVSRLTAGVASRSADDAQIAMMEVLLRLYRDVYKKNYSDKVQELFRGRILADILFYAEKNPAVRKWLADGGWAGFDFDLVEEPNLGEKGFYVRWEKMRNRIFSNEREYDVVCEDVFPHALKVAVAKIERRRKTSTKDLYIVTGQLNSRTNEPIDSWTFFKWLQKQGVPSRYVIWKEHAWYAKMRDAGELKDVIVMNGDGVGDYEFVAKCSEPLIRARAVVQENAALNSCVRSWLKELPDCSYVFLQHGVFYTWFTSVVAKTLSLFNFTNVASEREREFILERTPKEIELTNDNFIIAGLPRWDLLEDLSRADQSANVIFVMLTWRMSLGLGVDRLERSAYYHRLKDFLSADNVKRLADLGVRIVLAPHHHLANKVKDLDFGLPVEIAPPENVSYWIRHAKMLVTDFSSVSIDFLFQGKPTVYWMLDHDDLLLDRANTNDGAKVVSALKEVRGLFNQVFKVSEVMGLIEHYAKNGFVLEPEKKAIAETFFAHKTDVCRHLYEGLEAVAAKSEAKEVQV